MTVGAPACSYATLSNYNQPSGVPVPRSTVSGKYIVPDYAAPTYDTLQHGNGIPSCNGYFTIDRAYKSEACNQKYITSLCQ